MSWVSFLRLFLDKQKVPAGSARRGALENKTN